jgi:carboxymethylenebutenolidase
MIRKSARLPVFLTLVSALFWHGLALAGDPVAATAKAHKNDRPVATPVARTAPVTEVIGETINYGEIDGKPLQGYIARPVAASGDLPGLIVIHEWWGLNDNIRQVTDRLAGEGYVALAVDLYGGGVATTPKEAMGLMQNLNNSVPAAESNLRQAYTYLNDDMSAPRIGVIGWCLGGRWSLQAALFMPDAIDAMVMYYGSVVTDKAQLITLQMPVMGNFAENDPIIPLDEVMEFSATLEALGKTADIKIYEGAKHAFSNPSGLAYDPVAAGDAWMRSTTFLAQYLGNTE